jgi:surface protein
MQSTFYGCSSLKTLDVSAWDVSAVTNMQSTFYGCSSLKTLDVSAWDVGAVTNMGGTFEGCSSLQSLDVSAWDTKNVTNMANTFWACTSLQSLDVSAWDTKNVTNMAYTFAMYGNGGNNSITSLDVSGFDTSHVTNMFATFLALNKVTTLAVENWNTENVKEMQTFCHMPTLTRLDLSKWSTKSVTTFGSGFYMFLNNMPKLTEILFGEGWGTNPTTVELNMQSVATGASYKLTDATWASMLTMYDRKSAGLADMTIKLSTKHNVPTGWEEQMTARGYIITKS